MRPTRTTGRRRHGRRLALAVAASAAMGVLGGCHHHGHYDTWGDHHDLHGAYAHEDADVLAAVFVGAAAVVLVILEALHHH